LFLDKGSLKNPTQKEFEDTTKILLNYFFIGIVLPNDTFWVNLRPDSEDNIIDERLAKTDVGKIMLEIDLQLKKDTAKFTSPKTPEGRQYWDKLYKKAGELFGSENITIPTLTRPWIVPDEIIIRETTDSAYIYKATLKVMLEEDYLKDSAVYNFKDNRLKELNEYSSQLIREIIIPKLTKEINSSKRYACLRQVYYSLILAQWFKARFQGKQGQCYELINSQNLQNLTSKEPWLKTTYFQEYQKSFKDGEYNIKEPVYTLYGQTIRSYFSGGEIFDLGRMPQLGQTGVNPKRGSIISSIPTATSPVVNLKHVMIKFFDWFKGQVTKEKLRRDYQDADEKRKGVVEFKNYVAGLKAGEVFLSLRISGDKAARQLGLSRGFALLYDELVTLVKEELQSRGEIDIDRVIELADGITAKEGIQGAETDILETTLVTLAIEKFQNNLKGNVQNGPIEPQDADEKRKGVVEFKNYVAGLKAGEVSFSLQISGDEAARQLGFISRGFALLYDDLVRLVKEKLRSRGKMKIDGVIKLADGIIAKEDTRGVKKDIKETPSKLDDNTNDSSIDRALNEFEDTIKNGLRLGQISRRDAMQAILRINNFLIRQGYLVEQSPFGHHLDRRVLVLYKIVKQDVSATPQGDVRVFFVRQVTQFSDGLLRGNPGWSSYFTNYVVVFRELIKLYDRNKIKPILKGGIPFKAKYASSDTDTVRQINRMAEICAALIKKGFSGLNSSQRVSLQEESIRIHEIEHEICRRKLGLKEGDEVKGLLNEVLADLRALKDCKEPWHVLSRIVELAAANTSYAWLVLKKLSQSTNRDGIISWLERISKQDISQIRQAAERAYRKMSSSPSVSPLKRVNSLGGIDFRTLPIVTQAVTNLSANISSSAIQNLISINLGEEWQQIERMASSGIAPSPERIKEYIQASCAQDSITQHKEKILLCILDILRQEEERCEHTNPTLRDILVVLESMSNPQEFRQVFLGKR
jgi:hypothetical protein